MATARTKRLKKGDEMGPLEPVQIQDHAGFEPPPPGTRPPGYIIYSRCAHLGYFIDARPLPLPDTRVTTFSDDDDPMYDFSVSKPKPILVRDPLASTSPRSFFTIQKVETLKMLSRYNQMDRRFQRAGVQVYKGDPQNDKVYLFLFCELKGVFENYQQVLADKDIIGIWKSKPKEEIYHLMNSSTDSIPKSLVLAKQIVAEKNLQLGSWDLVECLEDVCTAWLWEEKQLAYKKYEEFLLDFWKENLRKPEPEEICATFCSGSTENLWKFDPEEIRATFYPGLTENLWDLQPEKISALFSSGKWVGGVERKYCTVSSCANPGSGKPCVGLTHYAMKQAGKKLLERLCEGSSTEECSQIIEENYKNGMSKPCPCRVHYIKSKLEEAEKTGLAHKIGELIPSFKDLAVRNVDMDQEKVELRSSAGAPV